MIYPPLLKRLTLCGLVLSCLFGYSAYLHSKSMVEDRISGITAVKLNVVKGRFQQLMTNPGQNMRDALTDAINYPPGTDLRMEEGHFVYAILHNEKRTMVGLYTAAEHEGVAEIQRYIESEKRSDGLPDIDGWELKSLHLGGEHYLEIHANLLKDSHHSDIFIRTFFELSPAASRSIGIFTARSVGYVVAIVLVTTKILYPVILFLLERLAVYSRKLLDAHLQTVEALGETIAKRDSDTNYHNYRVTLCTVRFAEAVGFPSSQMPGLIKGAFLHDIGKIGIRDNILLTEESFDEKEYAIMKKHVGYGLEIIHMSSWLKDAAHIVGYHHEKFDGSGYPAGVSGRDIPLAARLFTIVDVFDALTSIRPYKKAYSYERTMTVLKEGRASHFDPELLDTFKEISQELYAEFAGREDDGLKVQFDRLTTTYFNSGLHLSDG